ncbi:type II secretion system protein [Ramlibacter tataouinensis]|uniref:Type II secretion system protein n=1 Tax=Ramlibacter tataouinensis (strain ATCC BAA-407 / DSM 14655 / LMG 21543 / TTB310) TaxID=365046 RepID=F5Y2I1_RAMTT|nr:type II secretion system protein [Ramlibacter tataouinensis]AEG92344.1 conserved hypothetical protein [Ramlibacter tataouinensis TTB310]
MNRARTSKQARGVVLLVVLLFVFLTTLAASGMVKSYQTASQREKEAQLLFAGDQYRRAIASYYSTVPAGQPRSLPLQLEDLVNDHRFPTPRHHLRRLYPDPITNRVDWGLVMEAGGIAGVYSKGQSKPLKQAGFPRRYAHFEHQPAYSSWVFRVDR